MKILYIPARRIMDSRDGGGVETQKMHRALKRIEEEHSDIQLDVLSDDLPFVSCHLRSNWTSRIFGHSLPFYFAWRKLRKKYLNAGYDVVVLGISRLGFVARDFKMHSYNSQRSVRVIAQFHNIEADYIEVNAMRFEGLSKEIFRRIETRAIRRDEGSMVSHMDMGIFLTRRDEESCKRIYGYDGDSMILPICVDQKDLKMLKPKENRLNLIFFGSLKFKPNQEAVLWFLRYVWKDMQNHKGLKLIIAGSEPTRDFVSEMRAHRDVIIYKDYDRIEPLLPCNSLFVAPILSGTGMKTKIADALSLGIPVIGSKEAMVGYEEALINDNRALNLADTPEDYISKINELYKSYSDEDFRDISLEAIKIWEKFYSSDRAIKDIYNLLNC